MKPKVKNGIICMKIPDRLFVDPLEGGTAYVNGKLDKIAVI